MRAIRGCSLLLTLIALAKFPPGLGNARGAEDFNRAAKKFLAAHCVSCHGPERQEAQVRLDRLAGIAPDNSNLWTMVHEKIAAREMPPRSRPQPAEEERKAFLTWVAQQQRSQGVGGTRRLNRRELSAALRDLTGLAIDFAAAPGLNDTHPETIPCERPSCSPPCWRPSPLLPARTRNPNRRR